MQEVERQLLLLQGDAQDSQGIRGIHLQRNVVDIAQKALKANLMALGPLVLPVTELVSPSLPLMPQGDAKKTRQTVAGDHQGTGWCPATLWWRSCESWNGHDCQHMRIHEGQVALQNHQQSKGKSCYTSFIPFRTFRYFAHFVCFQIGGVEGTDSAAASVSQHRLCA